MAPLLLALAGCSGEAGSAPPGATASTVSAETATTAQASTTSTAGPPHGGHPGGPEFLIGAALHESINLTADQRKTIEGLTPGGPDGPRPLDKARAATLAASIRAGKVDTTPPARPSDADATTAARRTAMATALTSLHATMTAAQRRALVDAVEQKDEQRARDEADGGGRGAFHPHEDGGGPLAHLLEGLDVTSAQEQEIKSKLDAARPAAPSESDRAAMKAHHEAMRAAMKTKLEAFVGDAFDAAAFVAPPAEGKPAGDPADHGDRFVTELAVVTSVLDASQREKLAEKIEAGPPAWTEPSGR